MEQLVMSIAKAICDKPDLITVNETSAASSSIIEVIVDKSDLGKMIGKNGQTAGAIRKIIYASSFKFNKRYTLEIIAREE